jgi:peptidoglycan/LPS O-acetylase OafA/YrhL
MSSQALLSIETKTVKGSTSSSRLYWLDALRGWAVLGVVAVHSGQAANSTGRLGKIAATGQYGVELFFFVSALTISLTYESHIRKFGTSIKSQFAWLIKRFFRIAPLYYLAAILYPVEHFAIYVASHHRYFHPTPISDIIANFLFVNTWIPSANNSVVPGGWSISVEMSFYLLVPFIWIVKPVRPRVVLLAASAIASIAITLFASRVSAGSFYVENNSFLYFWFPTQAPVIILGLIFYLFKGTAVPTRRSALSTIVFLLCASICFVLGLYLGAVNQVQPILAPSVLTIAFILLILGVDLTNTRVFVSRHAIQLGKISFSVYIVHFFVLDLIHAAIKVTHLGQDQPLILIPIFLAALGISSAIAIVSKRVIEDPGISIGHQLSLALASGADIPARHDLKQ